VADAGRLLVKIPIVTKSKVFNPAAEGFISCDSCSKPDIFLIIPDQYTGYSALKNVFDFDNTAFENELKRRGFYVAKQSSSNYNFTPFSVASTLNLKKGPQNYNTVSYSYGIIRNSRLLKFLAASGYQFYNCSIFDFDQHPAHKYTAFLPYGTKLITDRTFTNRIWKDLENDIIDGKYPFENLRRKLIYENLDFNDRILKLTSEISAQETGFPKFVYTHLMIPHYPYYFDSKGQPLPIERLTDLNKSNANDYIEYLQYGNKKLLKLVDDILANAQSPPIIVILSDHGFRHPEKSVDPVYDFINLNAVYFPEKNYGQFYDTITNVNQFRVIFNSCFYQHLPLLKDSSTNLRD
jgi:hypothetical protein